MNVSLTSTQERLLQKCDVLQAIFAFNYRYGEIRDKVDGLRQQILQLSTQQLDTLGTELLVDNNIAQACRLFGCQVSPTEILKWFNVAQRNPAEARAISKHDIVTLYFSNFAGGIPGWQTLTPHHLIAMDFTGEYSLPELRWHLPEAALYEDLCLAVNLAIETQSNGMIGDPIRSKTNGLYLRTGVLTAYYFVEAYLNGIAFDYYVAHPKDLSARQKDLLLEWNSENGQRQWCSFEKKIREYPKIILSKQHPVITVTSSENLKILLEEGKEFRDAIVHHSPRNDPATDKVMWWTKLRIHHLLKIADAAIGVVRELNTALGPNGTQLTWLIDRGSGGTFPKEVFL